VSFTRCPLGHKINLDHGKTCRVCQQNKINRAAKRSQPPARRHIYPQYYRWLREIKAEVRRISG
jgi:hypothetical protein